MKYIDIIAYFIFILCFPFILCKLLIILLYPFVFIFIKTRINTFAYYIFKIITTYCNIINYIERLYIYILSICLYPYGIVNYINNRSIIEFFNKHTTTASRIKEDEIIQNIINAQLKTDMYNIIKKMFIMYVGLSTYKYCFYNNPFLFYYKIQLVNHTTKPFQDIKIMCNIIDSYITNNQYVISKQNSLHITNTYSTIQNTTFIPNYYNDITDFKHNYNNVGLQITNSTATLLYLETIVKTHFKLYENLKSQHFNISICDTALHPIYNDIYRNNLTDRFINRTTTINAKRVSFIDIVIPYIHNYHMITGIVEVNVRDDNIIEHPMLCLYHNGYIMSSTWETINTLFNTEVSNYLNNLEFI